VNQNIGMVKTPNGNRAYNGYSIVVWVEGHVVVVVAETPELALDYAHRVTGKNHMRLGVQQCHICGGHAAGKQVEQPQRLGRGRKVKHGV